MFSTNWGKEWVSTYTTVAAFFSTIFQPYRSFRKLLAIIPSMKNHLHLIPLNQKINTNTKLPVTNLASVVIPNQMQH